MLDCMSDSMVKLKIKSSSSNKFKFRPRNRNKVHFAALLLLFISLCQNMESVKASKLNIMSHLSENMD